MTALTQSEVWDRKLAVFKDACHVQQRLALATNVGTTLLTFTPVISGSTSTVGVRLGDLGVCFEKWRINRMLIRVLPLASCTLSLGVTDDPDPVTQPANIPAINDLRVSRSFSTFLTDSGSWELDWTPVDKRKWYYCQLPSTGTMSDYRLSVPLQIFALASVANAALLQVYLDITFEGAADPTTTG